LEKANVLVTGGAGFIGSHLVDALVDRGHRVRVLDALVSQVHGENAAPTYLNSAAEFIQADICDRDAVAAALEDIDVVFHEAAEVGVGQSMYEIERYVRANDLGTAVLLEAILARKSQIKKLVVASSMSIYGEGAYTCETCGAVAPQLRPSSQLLERRWEVECPSCGKEL
jgi:dTDP-L-rhamnose 4-epimerase